jgi:hypothetical protein
MDTPTPLCECSVCTQAQPEYYVAPLAQLRAVRARTARTATGRLYCPRCGERLGFTESVLDSVGYSHFVQPCAVCSALWVLS